MYPAVEMGSRVDMARKMRQFWQIVDVFDSDDGTMFTVWDHIEKKRRSLHAESEVHGFRLGDIVTYDFIDGKVRIKPVEADFVVPAGVTLLMPQGEDHSYPGVPADGLLISSRDFRGRKFQQA